MKCLTGINILEEQKKDDGTESTPYEIEFMNLPDDYLDEQNFNSYPENLKQIISQLSNGLLDKYRSIFRKRKIKNNQIKNNLSVNNLEDFQKLYDNYLTLMLFLLTKLEISEVKKYIFSKNFLEILKLNNINQTFI